MDLRNASGVVLDARPDPASLTRGEWLALTASAGRDIPAEGFPGNVTPRPAPPASTPGPGWQDLANCRGVDPDLFFPEGGGDTATPKAVCAGCVVRDCCLEGALARGEQFGIWGGTSTLERKRIRRARSLATRAAAS